MTTATSKSASIFVTGATGKTGKVLVEALSRRGVAFRAGVRQPEKVKMPDTAKPVRFDWNDRSTYGPAAEGMETLYLVKPSSDQVAKVRAFFNSAPSIRRVVLLSEFTAGLNPPEEPERAIEMLVAEEGRTATILRPAWFYQGLGRGGQFGPALRDEGVIRLPVGKALMAWTDVRDIVDVAVKALLGEDLGIVQITGPEDLILAEVAARISAATGREMKHESPPIQEFIDSVANKGTDAYSRPDEHRLRYLIDVFEKSAAGHASGVTQEVARILGRPPRPLNAYIAENAAYWRGDETALPAASGP